MKLPKELQEKNKSIRSQISVKELFNFVNINYERLMNLSSNKLTIVFSRKINNVSLKSKNTNYYYELLKEKFDQFNSEINFKCMKCRESCCYISDETYAGIYKEDLDILQKNHIDDSGYIIPKNKYSLDEINKKGYSRILKIIKETNKTQCYYFDSNKKICKIYEFRPIVCYLFPFKIQNGKIMLFKNCDWVLNNAKGSINFNEFKTSLFALKSSLEFMTSTALFLKKKKVIIFDKITQKFRIN